MKKLLSLLSLMLLPLCVFAADAPKLGIVDLQRALNGVEEGKTARDKFKKELESSQKEIDKRKAELEGLQKELDDLQNKAASGLLKPEAMEQGRKKQMEFQKKFEEYTNWVQGKQAELQKKEQEATQVLLGRLKTVVDDIGRKDGFHMIMERNQSGLLYASTYTDLTEKLIQEFNKSSKKK